MSDFAEHEIELGTQLVPFTLRRSDRSTLGITVFPDRTVLVAAPREAELDEIIARLRRRGAWLLRARRDFESFRPRTTRRGYVSGETHRYLGRQLRLSLRLEAPRGVEIEGTSWSSEGSPLRLRKPPCVPSGAGISRVPARYSRNGWTRVCGRCSPNIPSVRTCWSAISTDGGAACPRTGCGWF